MGERSERWGVFAWMANGGHMLADIHNTYSSKQEAADYAATLNRELYDGVVVCSEDHFDECWKLIGATVVGG